MNPCNVHVDMLHTAYQTVERMIKTMNYVSAGKGQKQFGGVLLLQCFVGFYCGQKHDAGGCTAVQVPAPRAMQLGCIPTSATAKRYAVPGTLQLPSYVGGAAS